MMTTYTIYEEHKQTGSKRVIRDGIKTLELATKVFQRKLEAMKKSGRYEEYSLSMKEANHV